MKRLALAAVLSASVLLPVWGHAASPSGGRIAFLAPAGSSGTNDIYSMKPDGTDIRQLTNLGPSGETAAYENWSFDGSKIVYQQYSVSGSPPFELWIINADGSGRHRLLTDPKYVDQNPSFSPRGDQVVFSRCSFKSPFPCTLYRVNLNGKALTQLTHSADESEDAFPVYSPDGTRIAFESIFRGGFLSRVFVMNADGSQIRPITPPELGGNEPGWAPDGSRIAFQTYDTFLGDFSQNEEIWSIDPDGNDLKQLTRINDSRRRVYGAAPHDLAPSWSPGGDAVVFERDNGPFTKHSILILNVQSGSLTRELSYAARPAMRVHPRSGPLINRIAAGAYPRWGPAR